MLRVSRSKNEVHPSQIVLQEAQEEFDEVQEDLRKKDAENESSASSLETGQSTRSGSTDMLYKVISRIFLQVGPPGGIPTSLDS